MKTVSITLFAAIIGCAFVQPAAAADAAKFKEKVLYSFCGQQNCADGQNPYASLLNVNGTLYGTTVQGGSGGEGCGTVFALTPR